MVLSAMSRPRPRAFCWLLLVVLIAASVVSAAAQGASAFRLMHTVDRGGQGSVSVSGRVFNDARADAIDVYVTAEAVDGGGKVVASGVSYVGAVPAGSSTAFIIKVPAAARAAANVRVLVTSFRFGFATQS